jgi:hypothetical protein
MATILCTPTPAAAPRIAQLAVGLGELMRVGSVANLTERGPE